MLVVKTVEELREERKKLEGKVSFVPTMGALHKGHTTLMKEAVKISDHLIVSVFVNPTQFGPGEDLDKYPRPIDKDLEACSDAGASIVFLPEPEDIYGSETFIKLHVEKLSEILCGAKRPGHFDGVVQVVSRLFNITTPDIALFGEKDYQQLIIIKRMVQELHFPVEIVSVPIVREKDGLAKSSRNRYLSESERKTATALYETLSHVKQKAEAARFDRRALPVEYVEREAREIMIKKYPDITIDYLEIRNASDLSRSQFIVNDSRVFGAVFIGNTRLIDNISLGE